MKSLKGLILVGCNGVAGVKVLSRAEEDRVAASGVFPPCKNVWSRLNRHQCLHFICHLNQNLPTKTWGTKSNWRSRRRPTNDRLHLPLPSSSCLFIEPCKNLAPNLISLPSFKWRSPSFLSPISLAMMSSFHLSLPALGLVLYPCSIVGKTPMLGWIVDKNSFTFGIYKTHLVWSPWAALVVLTLNWQICCIHSNKFQRVDSGHAPHCYTTDR